MWNSLLCAWDFISIKKTVQKQQICERKPLFLNEMKSNESNFVFLNVPMQFLIYAAVWLFSVSGDQEFLI